MPCYQHKLDQPQMHTPPTPCSLQYERHKDVRKGVREGVTNLGVADELLTTSKASPDLECLLGCSQVRASPCTPTPLEKGTNCIYVFQTISNSILNPV